LPRLEQQHVHNTHGKDVQILMRHNVSHFLLTNARLTKKDRLAVIAASKSQQQMVEANDLEAKVLA
jgi:hypothetical protein